MEMMLNKIVPEVSYAQLNFTVIRVDKYNYVMFFALQGLPYRHSCEGPDDMVSIPHFL